MEAVDEVLREVGPPCHAQLAEEAHAAAVQPDDRVRPRPYARFALAVEPGALLYYVVGFQKELLLLLSGKVLEDAHVAYEPLAVWVEVFALLRVPFLGRSDQLVQGLCETGVYRGAVKGRPYPLRNCHVANLS